VILGHGAIMRRAAKLYQNEFYRLEG
jgi:hypothetical protein